MITTPELRSTALHFIQNQHLLHLATLDNNNHPDVTSVVYYCTDDFHFYFSARSSSRKFSNLSHCEHVGFSITNETEQITVQGKGIARMNTDPAVVGAMLAHLAGVSGEPLAEHWPPPILKIHDGTYHVLEIIPDWLRFGDFRDIKPEQESYFTQII